MMPYILFIIAGIIFPFMLRHLMHNRKEETWYFFIVDNIAGCKTTDDIDSCTCLLKLFTDTFSHKVTFKNAIEYEEMVGRMIIKLRQKSEELMKVRVSKMTVENILNDEKF